MNAGKAIYSKLTSDTDVSNLIGTRCFAGQTPTGITTYPMVITTEEDEERDTTYSGPSGLIKQEIEVVSKSTSYGNTQNLAEKVLNSLNQGKGTWGAVTVLLCSLLSENESHEFGDGTDEQEFFMKTHTFNLWSQA